MIDLTVEEAGRQASVDRARERSIGVPTFAQMRDPSLVPEAVKARLVEVGSR